MWSSIGCEVLGVKEEETFMEYWVWSIKALCLNGTHIEMGLKCPVDFWVGRTYYFLGLWRECPLPPDLPDRTLTFRFDGRNVFFRLRFNLQWPMYHCVPSVTEVTAQSVTLRSLELGDPTKWLTPRKTALLSTSALEWGSWCPGCNRSKWWRTRSSLPGRQLCSWHVCQVRC